MERALVAERLKECGLTEKEAHLYLELLMAGPLKASDVARRVNLSRMDAYNQLKRLADRGIVRATLERPMRFVPLPVEDALDALVREGEESIQRIRAQKEVLRDAIKPHPDVEPGLVEATFRIHQDRRTIHSQIRKMIAEAKEEVLVAATKRSIGRYASAGVLEDLQQAKARRVKVRILTQVDEDNLDPILDAVARAPLDMHHSDRVGSNLIIVDGRNILNSLIFDDAPGSKGKDDVALWTDSLDFVRAQKAFFAEAWEESTSLEERSTEIRTGRVVEPIKAYIGEGSMYERFRELLRQNPEGLTEVNAHLLKQGTTYGLRHFGIEPAHIFNLIGHRIGVEIAHDMQATTRPQLWKELRQLYAELGLGRLHKVPKEERIARGYESGPVIQVDNCFSCRGMPTVGHPICAVDEGIIQGIIETRLATGVRVRELECTGTGHAYCLYQVRFLDEAAAREAEAEKTARAHAGAR